MATQPTRSFAVSPTSEKASRIRPGRKLLCSSAIGWTSLLVQTFEQPSFVDRYETLPSEDVLLVLVLRGQYQIESLSTGTWRQASYRPGVLGITASMTTNRLRWQASTGENSRVLRTYLPHGFLEEAAEELRRPGNRRKLTLEDRLAVSDPAVTALLQALASAAKAGLPDLYAETAARHLATHLLIRSSGWSDEFTDWNFGAELSDRRLARTLEFMAANFATSLTIAQLANVAGISPFHFCRLFKAKLGISPHRYQIKLRIQHAVLLLNTTDFSISEIALECGYSHTGHFAAMFEKVMRQKPASFRKFQS